MTKNEALKLALEALDGLSEPYDVLKAQEAIKEALAQPEQEPVAYTGNGTAGREADVRPTGFFFQADKIGSYTSDNPEHQKLDLSLCDAKRVQLPVGEVYGWHGAGDGKPLCRFNVTESNMPVGSLLYTTPQPQREWVGLTDEEIETIYANCNAWDKFEYERMLEAKLKEKNT